MSDKIEFNLETGIMTINDIYEIKPRMTVEEAKNTNLMDLLSPKVGLEYVNKAQNPNVIFRAFSVDNTPVRVNLNFEFWGRCELGGIDVVVRNFGEEARYEKSPEEFNEICRIHDEFLYNMCVPRAGMYSSRLRFHGGYIDKIYDNRTPNIKIQIKFWRKERIENEERFNNLSRREQMREIRESMRQMDEEDRRILEEKKNQISK